MYASLLLPGIACKIPDLNLHTTQVCYLQARLFCCHLSHEQSQDQIETHLLVMCNESL